MPARSPEEFHPLFCRYMREGDLDSVLTLYDRQAVCCNRSGEVGRGVEALRRELAPFAAARADFRFQVTRKIESGDIALVHDEWRTLSPQPQPGHAMEVYRRQADGAWRLLIGDPFTIRVAAKADAA